MTHDLNRAQRSALHSNMLTALSLTTDAKNDVDARLQAWCETIAWAEYPEDVLNITHAIANFLAKHDYVEVDARNLREIEGAESVNLALRLNGIHARPSGRVGTVWTNCPPGARGTLITLPPEILT